MCTKRLAASLGSSTPVRLANESHYELPPVSDWKEWCGTPAPGYHYTEDLNAARAELLLSGRSPKVILRNAAAVDMVALRYTCVKARDGGVSGACVIRELPPDREAIERFLKRLPRPVVWCGEAVPGLMQKVLLALLQADMEYPSAEVRARVLADQNHSCNSCATAFEDDLAWDHVAPLPFHVPG